MEKVPLVKDSVEIYRQGNSVIMLRPFRSVGKIAIPSFEVLPWSAGAAFDEAPSIVNFLDENVPVTCRGRASVSVSLGDRDVSDTSLPEYLMDQARQQNIDPSRMWLEISETAASSGIAWKQVVPELAGYDFPIMVNRFISDQSGFDILASPHVAGIKLAPAVIANLPASQPARRYLKGLQTLVTAVNKQLIVDGVETLGQALWLKSVGCQTFQGPFYGNAMELFRAPNYMLERRQQIVPTVIEPDNAPVAWFGSHRATRLSSRNPGGR